jgi:hypothetical protein
MSSPKSNRQNTKVIITAAGESRRWKNHLGVPKHLVPVPGPRGSETLLARQVRQARELGVEDVVIVCPPNDDRYITEGASLYPRLIDPQWHDADRFMTTELWNKDGRTLYTPGDMYASDDAMRTMVCDETRTWVWYLRLHRFVAFGLERSRAIFGFGFWPEHHDFFLMTVKYVTALQNDKESLVKRSLGIDLYRAMAGEPPEEFGHRKGQRFFREYPPHSVLINDITTDLDRPQHHEILLAAIAGQASDHE